MKRQNWEVRGVADRERFRKLVLFTNGVTALRLVGGDEWLYTEEDTGITTSVSEELSKQMTAAFRFWVSQFL